LRLLGRGQTPELDRVITDFNAWLLVIACRQVAA
jgi:hypothetical protein